MSKTKILIAGIGGVGGYFGGLLAKEFHTNDEVEINFLARGSHLREIQSNGLKVVRNKEEFIAKPKLATDDPTEIGRMDFVILCTKSYDLERTIQQLNPCIDKNTIILPLLNGVDSKERIDPKYPDNIVLNGCVYVVSRLKQPGVIEKSGEIEKLYFGLDNLENKKLDQLQHILSQANIDSTLSTSISQVIWEKYIFISPMATATSYFNNSIGKVLEDTDKFEIVKRLVNEITGLASALKIQVAEDIVSKTITRMKSLNYEGTSSMHSDFINKKPVTEIESLTGYIVREGFNHKISTPTYKRIYDEMANQ